MYKFCVFAGTTEGRELAEFLLSQGAAVTACVATQYGEALLPPAEGLSVLTGKMDREDMAALMSREGFDLVLDATHPYAAGATENISTACAGTGTEYLRVLREESRAGGGALYFPDIPAIVSYLNARDGKVLLATGSRDLGAFAAMEGFASRVWARVLPVESSIAACRAAGLPPSHILGMQGPFSAELNASLLRSTGAAFLVTKDGGDAGGFVEKEAAAEMTGAALLVLGRPPQREGKSLPEAYALLRERFGFCRKQRVTVAGIGPGGASGMTGEVREAIAAADCLIGARRMLQSAALPGQKRAEAVTPERIAELIRAHPEHSRFAVLMSGDTGFFSGAKKLLPLLAEAGCEVKVLPGLSSLSCLCARLGTSYEDVAPLSLHGRECDIAAGVRRHRRVFVLTGGENGAGELCRRLTAAGLGEVRASVGEKLGYPDECVSVGSAAELAKRDFDSLSAVLIENAAPDAVVTPGLPDEAFQRAEGVPMTKSEVRALALSKLALTEYALCWDVGAGTGSVTVEMGLLARKGTVYAIERSEAALTALRENVSRFGLDNVQMIPGTAPEACRELPAPSHVFLGGTGGRAREIIALALEKNPRARIVAAAVTLETIAELTSCLGAFPFAQTEVVSLSAARDRKAGPYHLMQGRNPVYLFSMAGGTGG